MIRFKTISIKNALSIETAKVPLDNQGLVLVTGPNGSGKSAMFDVLRNVLYGNTTRDLKGKAIIRAGADDGYLAKLDLSISDQKYRIVHAHGHSEHGTTVDIFKGAEQISHMKSKVKNQQQLQQLVGLTAQQFDAAVCISQEAAHPLVNGSGAECAAYLSSTFGLDSFDELVDKVKEHIKRDDKQLGEIQAHKQTIARQQEILAELASASTLRAQKSELDIKLAANASEHAALVAEQTRLNEQNDAQKRLRTLRATYADLVDIEPAVLRKRLVKQRAIIEDLVTELAAAEKDTERQRERAALEKRIAVAKTALKEEPVTSDQKAIRKTRARIDDLAIKASALDRISGLDGETSCPTCGQAIDAEHIKAELEAATAAATKLAALRKELRVLEAQADAAENQARRLEKVRTSLEAYEEQLAAMPQIATPKAIDVLQNKIASLRTETAKIDRWLAESEKLQIDRTFDPAAIEKIAARIQACTASKTELMATYTQVTGDLRAREAAERVLADAQGSLSALEALWQENSRRKTLVKALRRLKIRRLHGIVRAIQDALPPYVSLLFGEDIRVEVDDLDPESIDRWCSRPNASGGRERIPVRALSKGERAKLRIAFVWAIRGLIRPERSTNILILDEADGGLDLLGLEAYGVLLDQLRGEYGSIFVISHRKELSTVQFDQIWTVRKQDGVSRVDMERA